MDRGKARKIAALTLVSALAFSGVALGSTGGDDVLIRTAGIGAVSAAPRAQ